MSCYLSMAILLFYGLGCINASEYEVFKRDQIYKRYFEEQEIIYKGLEELKIPGARPLDMDAILVKSVLEISPNEVSYAITDIKQRVFFKNKKNIIFHGVSGTGKSALAQAIAIECQVPCLFFNVGGISTEYMNSGVQNLNKIFQYAKELEKALGKPCIIIFDELESLTKKHVGTNNHENNILITFWQELDKLSNSQVIVIGTMNGIDDVPEQIINRTRMIEIPLPTEKQREVIVSYHLKKIQDTYNLEYPQWLTATYFAWQTKGYSNRDLENVVTEALRPAIRRLAVTSDNNIVKADDVSNAIRQIKQDFIEKKKRDFKKYLYDSKFISVAGLVLTIVGICTQIMAMHQSKTIANMQMKQSEINAKTQINQSQVIVDKQMNTDQIVKTAIINAIVAIPLFIANAVLR